MATTKNSKTTKSEVNGVVKMILKSRTTWYMKTLALVVLPFVVVYLVICGILKMILYPILYVVLTLISDYQLRRDVLDSMKIVYSFDYWCVI